MMSKNPDTPKIDLEMLGLDQEESEIFLYLNESGPHTALKLSRVLKLPRTRVYRILERLKEKQFVNTLDGEYGSVFQAINPRQLNRVVAEKEVELTKLSASLAELIPRLEEQRGTAETESQVVHYRGTAGLRQMVWNTLSAEDGLSIFEISSLTKYLGYQFAEKVRTEFLLRKIKTRQISNEKSFEGWTDVRDYMQNFWEIRYIPEEMLKIRFEVTIYNDVYAMLTYDAGELFGVEIHNPQLAEMQKQNFEFMWQNARQMRVIDDRGAAELAE